jgi:hypothetical protein
MFGIIESLEYIIPDLKKCETVLVREVKMTYKKIKENNLEMEDLYFKAGRGGG